MTIRFITLLILSIILLTPDIVFGQSESFDHTLNKTINITDNNYPYVEPHAAVNPEDPSNIVVGAMSLPERNKGIKIEVFHSLDGGTSWKTSILPESPLDGGDPQVAFGTNGTVYLLILPATLYISKDKGKTFKKSVSLPVQSSEADTLTGSYDYPKLVSDAETGNAFVTARQSIRISEDDSYSTSSVNLVKYNASESTFSGLLRNTLGYMGLKAGNPVFTANNNLIFPVSEITKFGSRQIPDSPRLWMARSSDGGNTLEPLRFVRENHMASIPSLASFKSNEGDDIVVASYANFEPEDFNLYTLISKDGGMSWSAPHRMNDDTAHTYTKRPESILNDNGILAHFWMDTRSDSTGKCFTPYFAYSKNYGQNYSGNIPLFDEAICNDTPGNQIPYGNPQRPDYTVYDRWKRGGDYFGLISLPENRFMTIWSDSRDGTYQIYSRKITLH